MKINSKNFLSAIASVLFFQSFNSVQAMDSTATKLVAGAVGVAAIATASGVWEYVPLQRANWRLEANKEKSRQIIEKKRYQAWTDEKFREKCKNIELYNKCCTLTQQDRNDLSLIKEMTDQDIVAWENRAKAAEFLKDARGFHTTNNNRLTIVNNRLNFLEQRKAFAELIDLLGTEIKTLRKYNQNRTSKDYSKVVLFNEMDGRIQDYETKIKAVEALEIKNKCLENCLKEAQQNKEELKKTQNSVEAELKATSPIKKLQKRRQ